LTGLAEIAVRADDAAAAERDFRAALALGIKDAYLLGAYADFLLDRGRPAEARELLAGETRADPLLLRLALAEQALGAPELAAHVDALTARFAASRMRGDTVHRREEARFTLHLLNDPATALQLAAENWRVQRETWDARLVLEAALAADEPSAAADVLDWLKATGLDDPQIARLVRRLRENAT
jgi:Tfp pilus assembly protein PilF